MTQAVEGKSIPGLFVLFVFVFFFLFFFFFFFSTKQCIPAASQGKSFVTAFDLRQQTICLRCLRQMETKSILVCLYTEHACCGSPSRHSGSSSALKCSRPLDTGRDQLQSSKIYFPLNCYF